MFNVISLAKKQICDVSRESLPGDPEEMPLALSIISRLVYLGRLSSQSNYFITPATS